MRNLSLRAALFLSVFVATSSHAEFLIDDFDVPQFADSDVGGQTTLENAVGFSGERSLAAAAISGATGHWRTDSSMTTQSVLHMLAENLVLEDGGYGLLGAFYSSVVDEMLVPLDFTENGINDAMRLDFAYSLGPTPIRNIRVMLWGDENPLVFSLVDPLPQTESPFSVYLPFAEFVDRGGVPVFDFTNVSLMEFQFQSAGNGFFPFHYDEGWQVGLDRISAAPLPTVAQCDLDSNGICDVADLDSMQSYGLLSEGYSADGNESFDMNGDGQVNLADRQVWLTSAAYVNGHTFSYLPGDANLDGFVDVSDFNLWNMNRFTDSRLWSAGNFNGDAVVEVADFNLWNMNKFQSSSSTIPVPEPPGTTFTLLLCVFTTISNRAIRTRSGRGHESHFADRSLAWCE